MDDRHGHRHADSTALAEAHYLADRIADVQARRTAARLCDVLAEHARQLDRLEDQIDRLGHAIDGLADAPATVLRRTREAS